MSESERPRSPFAGMADLSARTPLRMLSPDEIGQMLAGHRLYLETEYHQGHRANFSSADLTGRDFSDLNLRGIKMDRALLGGAEPAAPSGFHAPLRDAISEEVETRGASSGHSSAPPRTQHHAGREYAPSLRESFICLSPPGPVTIPRYAPFPVRGSVDLSRQFLEKLTDSAIIKVAPCSRHPKPPIRDGR